MLYTYPQHYIGINIVLSCNIPQYVYERWTKYSPCPGISPFCNESWFEDQPRTLEFQSSRYRVVETFSEMEYLEINIESIK